MHNPIDLLAAIRSTLKALQENPLGTMLMSMLATFLFVAVLVYLLTK